MKLKPQILLIYTGGTIGMVKKSNSTPLITVDFNALITHIPELKLLDCKLTAHTFDSPIDSSEISPAHWSALAKLIEQHYHSYDGFVILHGSDTMSYSASALSFMLENLTKPVIFTGSQLPIGDLRTDAKENLITSIQIASLHKNGIPVVKEVGLYFEYKLYRGNRTTKINVEHFQAFSSFNYPVLIESGVNLKVYSDHLLKPKHSKLFKAHKRLDTSVALIKIFPGISKSQLEAILHLKDVKVVILETYGSGNAPTRHWFLHLIKERIDSGIHIINVTQCVGGAVHMGKYQTSLALRNMGVISGKDITKEAALCKAMFLLGKNTPNALFKKEFETSLRGEMSN